MLFSSMKTFYWYKEIVSIKFFIVLLLYTIFFRLGNWVEKFTVWLLERSHNAKALRWDLSFDF